MDDNEIARIIAEEASKRRERARLSGVMSYMDPLPTSTSIDVNKRYLGAVVHSVLGHNRREQQEGCWRQRSLDEKASSIARRPSFPSASAPREGRKRPVDEGSDLSHRVRHDQTVNSEATAQSKSREEWALRKARARVGASALNDIAAGNCTLENLAGTERELVADVGVKKKHKKKKEKEKKKHKKHKHKQKTSELRS